MSGKLRNRLLFGGLGVVGLVCLLVTCLGAFPFGTSNPTGYVRDHYQRAAHLDKPDGGAAYTSSKSRASVVRELRDDTRELDYRHAAGVDFLQYGDHIVAVQDRGPGTMIYVDGYRDGYRRYSSNYHHFAFFGWSSSPPGSGSFLGGGGGFGK